MLPIHSLVGDTRLLLRGADSVSKPNLVSTMVLIDVVNSVEGLVNLAYLIKQNRHNPDDVLRYIETVDVTLKRMTNLIIQTHMLETLETTAVRHVVNSDSKRGSFQPSANGLTPDFQCNQRFSEEAS